VLFVTLSSFPHCDFMANRLEQILSLFHPLLKPFGTISKIHCRAVEHATYLIKFLEYGLGAT